jgi:hypothetical protein
MTARSLLFVAFTLLAVLPLRAADRVVTAFSSLNAKHALGVADSEHDKKAEIDYFTQLCPGYAGFEIIHEGGDLRSWLRIRKGKTQTALNGLPGILPKGFAWEFPSVTGELIEWRGVLNGDVFQPHAIIFRVSGSENEGAKPVTKSCLVVAALAPDGTAKLLGAFMGKDEDKKAAALADQHRPQ